MTPDTADPVCEKTTSESPKSLPLVHHFPSIEAGGPLVDLFEVFAELLLAGFVVLAGAVDVPVLGLLVVVAVVVAPPDDLPPVGCADACPQNIRTSVGSREMTRMLLVVFIVSSQTENIVTRANLL